ncbi:MAG: shikimate dehydrogenase [Deltaproteobacteria bacterium]
MKIDGRTVLHGIMGLPVSHSLSPAMHNAAFEALGLNCVYVPFAVEDVPRAMDGFRALKVRGVSVTIPYKQAVIPYLDRLDSVAERIGAVNTLVIDEQGRIKGFNTDWLGANRALAEHLELIDKKVVLLGAGGSARAIGFGLLEAGARPILCSRTPERGKALAADLSCQWVPLQDAADLAGDVLINATSVGMAPENSAMPVPKEAVRNFSVVMDIVYSPLRTTLLRVAEEAGCLTVNGLAMLLRQGAAQFEMWTGKAAPIEVMRASLAEKIG